MSAFSFEALDAEGQLQTGVIEADSARQARTILRERTWLPLTVHTSSVGADRTKRGLAGWIAAVKREKLTQTDVLALTRQLATLLAASFTIDEALGVIATQAAEPRQQRIVMGVRSRVVEGHTLAQALREYPQSFSTLYYTTVAAGEQSGRLEAVLERLADTLETQAEMRHKMQHALIYPVLMTVVSLSIVMFLMIFVVPKMMAVFIDAEQSLPFATQVLLAISHAIKDWGGLILISVVGLSLACQLYVRSHRLQWHASLLRVPKLNKRIALLQSARFMRTFAILNASGVPAVDAMLVASHLITNISMRAKVKHAASKVREGAPISATLLATGHFEPVDLYLIASGENSGRLSEMLERVADSQDKALLRMRDVLLKLFEPALILTMGAIILFIVLAVLLPIFAMDSWVG